MHRAAGGADQVGAGSSAARSAATWASQGVRDRAAHAAGASRRRSRRSQAGTGGPSASRTRPSPGGPAVSSSSPKTSSGGARAPAHRQRVVAAGGGQPDHAGVTGVPAGSSSSPARASSPGSPPLGLGPGRAGDDPCRRPSDVLDAQDRRRCRPAPSRRWRSRRGCRRRSSGVGAVAGQHPADDPPRRRRRARPSRPRWRSGTRAGR